MSVVPRENPNERKAVAFGAAALLLGASGLLSRILGYARDMLLAALAGVGWEADAYFAAFVIPDLLNYLLAGGALAIAFLPLYTRALGEGEESARELFATVLGGLAVVVVSATAVMWWQADRLVSLQFPQFDAPTHDLTVDITRIVLPAQIFFVLGGVLKATVFARGRFFSAAIAPVIYNLAIISGGALLYSRFGVPGFAWGVLVGAFLGPFLAPLLDARRDGPITIRVRLRDRRFLKYLWLAAPLMLGQSLLTVDEWFDKWFGGLLGAGSVASISYARRLMLVPVAIVGQAIATAALPFLTRMWEERKQEELDRTVTRTLESGLTLALASAAALVVLAEPLVSLFYQRGAWTAGDTATVARLLAILALAVPAWIVQQIAVRPFYARGDTWRPMILGTLVVVAAIPLYRGLALAYGTVGLAWAGVIGMSINATVTLLFARRRHGAPSLAKLGRSALRAGAVAIGAGALGFAALRGMNATGLATDATSTRLLRLAVPGAVLAVALLAGLMRFGDESVRSLLRRRLGRFAK